MNLNAPFLALSGSLDLYRKGRRYHLNANPFSQVSVELARLVRAVSKRIPQVVVAIFRVGSTFSIAKKWISDLSKAPHGIERGPAWSGALLPFDIV